QHFGIPFITQNLIIEFPVIDGREICAIRIAEGTEPVYITTTDKHGNKTERFYVRSGNSSQEISHSKRLQGIFPGGSRPDRTAILSSVPLTGDF
ncbi:MAG: hypothetical protein KAI95_19475, partial [Bacteroidales bacterium]|nr:hypothetical protein [Bacteroidales bacterium]